MRYKILSKNYFSLHYWFLNEGVEGIYLQYHYRGDAFVILDSEFLDSDESGEEQFAEELEFLHRSIRNKDQWKMNFPAPYYFREIARSATWEKPPHETNAGKNGLLIDSRFLQIRIDLEDRQSFRTFGTWDKDFTWGDGRFSLAQAKQVNDNYQALAELWNSECWRSHELLIRYMKEKRNLELDENEAEFYSPELIKIK